MSRRMIWLQILVLLVLAAGLIVLFIGVLRYELDAAGFTSVEQNGTQFLSTTIYPVDANSSTFESPENESVTTRRDTILVTTELIQTSTTSTLGENSTKSHISEQSQTLSTPTSNDIKQLSKENVTGKAKSSRTTTRGISPAHSAVLPDEYDSIDEIDPEESELDESASQIQNTTTKLKPKTGKSSGSKTVELRNKDFSQNVTETPTLSNSTSKINTNNSIGQLKEHGAASILLSDVPVTDGESVLNNETVHSLNTNQTELEIPDHEKDFMETQATNNSTSESTQVSSSSEQPKEKNSSDSKLSINSSELILPDRAKDLVKILGLESSELEIVEDTYSEVGAAGIDPDYSTSNTDGSEVQHQIPVSSNLNPNELKILDPKEDLEELPGVEDLEDSYSETVEETDTISEEQTVASSNVTSRNPIPISKSDLEPETPESSDLNRTDREILQIGQAMSEGQDYIKSNGSTEADISSEELPADHDSVSEVSLENGRQLTEPTGSHNLLNSNQSALLNSETSDPDSDGVESNVTISEEVSQMSESDPTLEITETDSIKSETLDVSPKSKSETTPQSSESESVSQTSSESDPNSSGEIKTGAVLETLESDPVKSDLPDSVKTLANSTSDSVKSESETVTDISSEKQLAQKLAAGTSPPVSIPHTYFVYHFTPHFHFQEYYPISQQIPHVEVPHIEVPHIHLQNLVVVPQVTTPQTVIRTHNEPVVTKSFYHYEGKSNYHWNLENSDGSAFAEQKNYDVKQPENKLVFPLPVQGGMYSHHRTDGKIYATHYTWYHNGPQPYYNFGGQSSSIH